LHKKYLNASLSKNVEICLIVSPRTQINRHATRHDCLFSLLGDGDN
jgi:hypothetical protein